jgi:DNA-binding transcriptional regulator YhcF (GntR family)
MLSKKDQIYQEILSRLFSGRYRFGEPIPVKEISEETGVSRQPIMTALYRLQDNGFVRITAQVGCEVVRPSVEEVSDFYRMFALIEGLIGELAAERGSDAELRRLQMINAEIASISPAAPQAATVYRGLNVEFHKQLHAMSCSPSSAPGNWPISNCPTSTLRRRAASGCTCRGSATNTRRSSPPSPDATRPRLAARRGNTSRAWPAT